MRPPSLMPVPCPSTHAPYSHRAFLLKALPLGSTGGPGRQDVEEDTHLAGEGRCEGIIGNRQLPPSPIVVQKLQPPLKGMVGTHSACSPPAQFQALTETAKATGPAKLQMSVS